MSCYCAATHAPCGWCEDTQGECLSCGKRVALSEDPIWDEKQEGYYHDYCAPPKTSDYSAITKQVSGG